MFGTARKLFTSAATEVPWKITLRFSHTEVKIPVPWGHVAGKWWNQDGRRPIIAVHGWQDNANSFDTLVPLMSTHLPVLAIDLPGHGHSSHFPPGFAYHRMTAVIVLKQIVEHFGWKNVSLMGHSLGGQTCFLYAAIFPEEVDAFAALDILAPIPLNASRFVKQGGKFIDEFLKRDLQRPESSPTYSYEKILDMVMKSPIAPVTEEAAKILLERGSSKCDDGKFRFTRDPRVKGIPMAGWSSNDIFKLCREIQANILCVKAKSSSYFTSVEFFDECWSNVKKVANSAELIFLPGGHHFHLEDPKALAPIVDNFFAKYYVKE